MKLIKFAYETKKALKDLGVSVIYLFGSRSQDVFFDISDYDIGVVLTNGASNKINFNKLYHQIYEILCNEIPDNAKGPKLDISFLQKASPALQASAIKNGQTLFETDPKFRADYEKNVVDLYEDYLPLKREYEQATIYAFK